MLALVITVLVVALPVVAAVTVVATTTLEATGVEATASAPGVIWPPEASVVAPVASAVVLVIAARVVAVTAVGRRMRPGAGPRPGAAETQSEGGTEKMTLNFTVTIFVLHRERSQKKVQYQVI